MTKRGMMSGRFQPFHNGHLKILNRLLELNDEVIVLISPCEVCKSTPFNLFEVQEIILGSVESADRYKIKFDIAPTSVPEGSNWCRELLKVAQKVGYVGMIAYGVDKLFMEWTTEEEIGVRELLIFGRGHGISSSQIKEDYWDNRNKIESQMPNISYQAFIDKMEEYYG